MFTANLTISPVELAFNRTLLQISDYVLSFHDYFAVVGFVVCLFVLVAALLVAYYVLKNGILSAIFVARIIRAQRPFHGVKWWQMAIYVIHEWVHYIFVPVDQMYIKGQTITWPGKRRRD